MSRPRRSRMHIFSAVAVVLILLSIVYRFLWLGNTPALNADEPYPIVQLMKALAGRPHLVRSPHGQFFNPVMMATELLSLLPGRASIFLLRLPAAIAGVVTLGCFAYCGRRVFESRRQVLFATLLLAAMPLSIATSRIQWDTSYLPLFECFVVFPMLDLAAGIRSRRAMAMLVGFSILGIWTHATFALLLVCLTVAVLFIQRRQILSAVAGYLGVRPSVPLAAALAAAPLVCATALFLALTRIVVSSDTRHTFGQVVGGTVRTAGSLLSSPIDLMRYIARVGDAISGLSTYEDIAGLPVSPALRLFSWLIVILLIVAAVMLARSSKPRDRALAVFWIAVPFILIGTAWLLALDQIGVERYLVWLLLPAAVTLARWAALLMDSRRLGDLSCALVMVPLAAIMLLTFSPDYFDPIRNLSWRQNTYPTYWSADIDPKSAAADFIRRQFRPTTVYVQSYWLDYPLQYDLGLDWQVTEDPPPDPLPSATILIVCFCDTPYTYSNLEHDYFDRTMRRLADAGRNPQVHLIPAADGLPAVAIIVVPTQQAN